MNQNGLISSITFNFFGIISILDINSVNNNEIKRLLSAIQITRVLKKRYKKLKLYHHHALVQFAFNLHGEILDKKRSLKIDIRREKHHTQYYMLAF